ncbi:alpha/beta fold hydrolase [Snodgrassella sp. CFCC 13594]|uniref:alpha/beta fold hydrolase n=1 Tax=Snodgrassella sp. CFCC 13594 TaxID=1775559 RepID=UPI001E3D1B0D|nr:alpha/beta fold hydrolase [Snodgrassella sp. CFCC 13594]
MSSPHPVWLIHGWAANHHIFDPVYAALPRAFQAAYHAPDLPGHGTTALSTNAFDLSAIAAAYAAQVSEPAHILGWSLGGMVAIKMAAHYPDKVASLCLVDSLPKVMADANYPQGLKRLAFADMVAQFETNYQQSMGQFLGLQMMYAAKETRRQVENLLPTIAAGGTPTGLRAALAALLAADLRQIYHSFAAPLY